MQVSKAATEILSFNMHRFGCKMMIWTGAAEVEGVEEILGRLLGQGVLPKSRGTIQCSGHRSARVKGAKAAP